MSRIVHLQHDGLYVMEEGLIIHQLKRIKNGSVYSHSYFRLANGEYLRHTNVMSVMRLADFLVQHVREADTHETIKVRRARTGVLDLWKGK